MFRYLRRSRTTSAVAAILDSYFGYTSLLLNGETPASPFNTDVSTNNTLLTPVGSVRNDTSGPFNGPGNYSVFFDGSTAFLKLPTSVAGLAFGSSDWTIEAWVYPLQATTQQVIFQTQCDEASAAGSGLGLYLGASAQSSAYVGNQGYTPYSPATLVNQWSHVAYVRNGGTFKTYLNGVEAGSSGIAGSVNVGSTAYPPSIGSDQLGTASVIFKGFISNLRVVNGTALYTSAFTPPTAPLTAISGTVLLACQSASLTDAGPSSLAVTTTGTPKVSSRTPFSYTTASASAYFNAATDNLVMGSNVPANLGSGDFTIEAWIYQNGVPAAYNAIIDARTAASFSTWIAGIWNVSGVSRLDMVYGASRITATTTSVPSYQWSHIALVRVSGTIKLFVNGVQDATTVSYGSAINSTSTAPYIGRNVDGNFFNGYMSNLRVVVGTAVYTTAFTPPTANLSAVSNTSLLTFQVAGPANNRGIVDSSPNNLAFSLTGNPTQGNVSPFSQTGWSTYFNNSTTDCLSFPGTGVTIGTNDFTMECWVNPSTVAATQRIMLVGANGTDGLSMIINASGLFEIGVSNTYLSVAVPAAYNVGAWHHLAVTRATGVIKFFIDGVQYLTGTLATSIATNNFNVGGISWVASTQIKGYLSNARLVNGSALYTANFTPPTSPLTAVVGTVYLTCQSNRIVDNGPNSLTPTITGTPLVHALSPFEPSSSYSAAANSGSIYFNGTTDRITSTFNPGLQLGTNNFAIEGYFYFNSVTAPARVCGGDNPTASGMLNWCLYITATGTLSYYLSSTGSAWDLASGVTIGTITVGQWYHVALQRNGNVITPYLNGVPGTTTTSAAAIYASTFGVTLGGQTTTWFSGYASNFRITNGTIVYQPFAAPTVALANSSVGDPYFQYNSLLLQGEGTNGSANNTFVDSSSNALTLTRGGTPTQGTFSPFSNAGYSAYFPTASDYLSAANTTATQMGTGDFTIECWAFVPSTVPANVAILTKNNFSWLIAVSAGNVNVYVSSNGSSWDVMNLSIGAIAYDKWGHFSITRQGTTFRAFYNGVQGAQVTSAGSLADTAGGVYAGYWTNGVSTFNGTGLQVSNVRLVKGTALYTSNFVPLTAPLTALTNTSLLMLQSNRFVDNSANALTITLAGSPTIQASSPFAASAYSASVNGGSMYFNGSTDYVYSAVSAANNLGSSTTWTVEGWFYPTAYASGNNVIVCVSASSADKVVIASIGTTGVLYYLLNGTAIIASTTAAKLNTWNHYALVKNGTAAGSTTLYLNGVLIGTSVSNVNATSSSKLVSIGADTTSTPAYYSGYQSNVRVISGTALYTGAFAVPTAPFTAITNTSVLFSGTNGGIVDGMGKSTVVSVGSAQVSTSVFKYGSSAISLNGTTDYLTIPNASQAFLLGTGDFTIELWVYPTSAVSPAAFVCNQYDWSSATGNWCFYANTGSASTLYFNAGGTNHASTVTATIPLNQWTHLAYVRKASVGSFYLNGVAVGAGVADTSSYLNAAGNVFIGDKLSAGGKFAGYLDDVRLTKGVARYTRNFAVPNAPVQSTSWAQVLLNSPNAGIVNAASVTDLITAGSAQTSSLQKKFGTKSIYFNGTTDYLSSPVNPAFKFSGDITVEAWIYQSTFNAVNMIFDCRISGSSATGFCVYTNASRQLVLLSGASPLVTSTLTVTANTWTHVAYIRRNGVNIVYVNGVASTQQASATNYTDGNCFIGRTNESAANYFAGYIDDLRVTNGVARYNGAGFTVPTQAYGDSTTADSYFNNVSLLLHADGTSYTQVANTNSVLVDSSYNALALTKTGNVTQGSFSPFLQNGWSVAFNGTSDYLTTPATSNMVLGTGDFTMEWWQNISDFSVSSYPVTRQSGYSGWGNIQWYLVIDTTATAIFVASNGGGANNFWSSPSASFTAGVWQHVAMVRSAGTWLLFVNGVSKTLAIGTGYNQSMEANTTAQPLNLGGFTGWGLTKGSLSNFRLVKGSALYTSSFTPSTTPLTAVSGTVVLALQDGRFKDNSGSNLPFTAVGTPAVMATSPFAFNSVYSAAVTGGSLYIPGSSKLSTTSTIGSFAFGTGDFTVEFWVNFDKAASANETVIEFQTTTRMIFGRLSTGILRYWIGSEAIPAASTPVIPAGSWTHIAVCRVSGTAKFYINGAFVYQVADATNYASTVATIGSNSDNAEPMTGYVSNLRVVKGTAVYTTAFTPSTVPLTPSYSASLLLSGIGAGILDSTGRNGVVAAGSAKTQSSVVKYRTGAIQFNGTTDYLYSPASVAFDLSSGNWTIEGWFYPVAITNFATLAMCNSSNTVGHGLMMNIATSGQWTYYINGSVQITGTAVTTNAWTHLAAVRNAGTTTLYVNGSSVGTTTNAPSAGNVPFTSGSKYNTIEYFNGYAADLRVTKGIARYTSNFTVPAASFANSTSGDANFNQVSLLLQGDLQYVTQNVVKNNGFLDSSANNLAITVAGTPIQGSVSPFSPGGWGVNFSSGNRISVASNALFGFGTGDFTVECWANSTGLGTTQELVDFRSADNATPGVLGISTTGLARTYDGSAVRIGGQLNAGWNHVAWVRASNVNTIYVNGAVGHTWTATQDFGSSRPLMIGDNIGAGVSTNEPFTGYISNLRMVKGTAVYNGTFTPSTAPLTAILGTSLLALQSGQLVDKSGNNLAFTITGAPIVVNKAPFAVNAYSASGNGGSVYFNGTTDLLTLPTTFASNLGTSDFTVECWVNADSTGSGANRQIVYFDGFNNGYVGLGVMIDSTNHLTFTLNGNLAANITSTWTQSMYNSWVHIALVRQGSVFTAYVNGASVGTYTSATAMPAYTINNIGAYNGAYYYFKGYISNVRLVSGTAVYTTAFTPPVSPLTVIANTQLLLSGTNGAVSDSSGTNEVTLIGGAQVIGRSKFGNGSIYLNGTSDYVTVPPSNSLYMGLGDFTIECWVYANAFNATASGVFHLTTGYLPAVTNNSLAIGTVGSTNWQVYCAGGSANLSPVVAPVLNTWTHIAMSRVANITRVFINGAMVFSGTDGATYTGTYLAIGGIYATSYLWNGMIEDFRVTKGIGRYTGSFTPPTAAFPTN